MAQPETTVRPTHAVIDTDALRHNLRLIRSVIPAGTRIMGVVKANAYGHGVEHCVPVLLQQGVDLFGVASAEEGAHLRGMGLQARIAVLSTPVRAQYHAYVRHDLEVFLSEPGAARELSAVAQGSGRVLGVQAYVDTGMGRNGASPAQAPELLGVLADLPGLRLRGLASHLATADCPDDAFALGQIQVFEDVVRGAHQAQHRFDEVHLANSGGVLNFGGSHHTLVRPGLALYGFHPTQQRHPGSGLKPVMTLRTVVTSLRRFAAGVSVSYGRRYFTPAPTTIATLPVGYGDGLMRILTNRVDALINGQPYPIVGTICMDEVMVDLGRPDTSVRVGDEVVLIGRSGTRQQDAWQLAHAAGTIPYEVTCAISARVPRISAPGQNSDNQ